MAPKMPEETLFDVRLVERHIRQGLTSRADYDAHLKKLADVAEQGDVVDMEDLSGNRSSSDHQAN